MPKKKKILVGMSGGVDSSVSAGLLIQQGFDVTGGFIKNWSSTKDKFTGECEWKRERRDAVRVASFFDIPLLTFDFENQYRRLVVDELYRGYEAGYTPNPDVLCNEYIKFGLFWEKAIELGFDGVATGHYAIVKHNQNGLAELWRGKDKNKDQSYFLYRVKQDVLKKTEFPVGGFTKPQIRSLAKKWNLPVATKPDSQGICFIGKINFSDFLKHELDVHEGLIMDDKGNVLGEHSGLFNYTIGQRQRIKIPGSHPWYVAKKDVENNILYVVDSLNHPWLQIKKIVLNDLHWISGYIPKIPQSVLVQVRYRQEPVKAMLSTGDSDKEVVLIMNEPVAMATLGQSAVIYKGLKCLGGGVIRKVEHL